MPSHLQPNTLHLRCTVTVKQFCHFRHLLLVHCTGCYRTCLSSFHLRNGLLSLYSDHEAVFMGERMRSELINNNRAKAPVRKRILIYGAGSGGVNLLREIREHSSWG